MGPADVEAVWRIGSEKDRRRADRFIGNFGLAEEAAREALVSWPAHPSQSSGWLMTTARRRAIVAASGTAYALRVGVCGRG
jgi:predicted RNA polymerase sigma factor